MRGIGCLIAVVLVAGGPSKAGTADAGIQIRVSRSSLRQGETADLIVRTSAQVARLTVRFAGRSWPVYAVGASMWRTILGTDPTTAAGQHVIAVDAATLAGSSLMAQRGVTVVRAHFPVRRITFDPERQALMTPEAVAHERRRVAEALRVLHPEPLWEDPFRLPVDGSVSSPYGVLSLYQGRVAGFHGGTDIAAPAGAPVYAAGRGIVRLAEALPLSGNAVMIDHGLGVVTSYLHLLEVRVAAGQRVEKEDVIGLVGSTGLATGPHLHWGLQVNRVRVDPIPWTR